MSQGRSCKCPRSFVRVLVRNANYSAFNGYHHTPSDYSRVKCTCCGATWRSKAKWVDTAPDSFEPPSLEQQPKCPHGGSPYK